MIIKSIPFIGSFSVSIYVSMCVSLYLSAIVIRLKELRYKKTEIEGADIDERVEVVTKELQQKTSSSVVDINFKLLEKYYEQHLVEYKLMARASMVIAILGFLVIIIGVFFTFANQVSVGVITSVAGLVSEAAAVMFFKQNNLLIEQVKEYHKKLVSTQYLLTTISLSSELPDKERIKQREKIIENLLFLSNELHGSPSSHLFRGANDSHEIIDSKEAL